MSKLSENSEQSQTHWYEELQHRMQWLMWSPDDIVNDEMKNIQAENWDKWVQLGQKAKGIDETFKYGTLDQMIRAYRRAKESEFQHLFEDLNPNETRNTLRFLLGLASKQDDGELGKAETDDYRSFTPKPKPVLVRSSALIWLLTLVVYIRSTNNLELLKYRADFATKFNALVPKRECPEPPTLKTSESSKRLQKAKTHTAIDQSEAAVSNQNTGSAKSTNAMPDTRYTSGSGQSASEVPVSLILVFSNERMSDLQAFADEPAKYQNRADLLKQYEWAWFGPSEAAADNRPVVKSNTANRDQCWLQLNLMKPLDAWAKPSRLKITDWINAIQKDPSFISSAEADNQGFNLGTSELKAKGFFLK